MSGDNPFVPREQSVMIGKFLLALSFFLPYLILIPPEDSYSSVDWMIYAPIWVLQGQGTILAGSFHPIALLMFQFWLPYTLIGYQAYRYASGRLSSERSYFLSIVILTAITLLLSLPLSLISSGSSSGPSGTEYFYSLYIPIPIFTILAVASYRLLRPTRVKVPWTEGSEPVDSTLKDESVWAD
jgi:fumarate reductase subunit D